MLFRSAGWIAVRAVLESGPTIRIRFQTADGIEPGKTRIRYRSVEVGEVRAIALAPDQKTVIVTAQMVKSARSLLAEDTRFWVVRPRIAAGGISGLGTLISGSYLGMDIGKSHRMVREFQGLEVPPVVASDVPGRDFVLHGGTLGSVEVGSPIYFRHVPVGRVTQSHLDADGRGVTVGIFVESPYHDFVVRDTRFWHASGFDLSFGSDGVRINTESVAAILAGGIAFETPPPTRDTAPAANGTHFRLADRRIDAMKGRTFTYCTSRTRCTGSPSVLRLNSTGSRWAKSALSISNMTPRMRATAFQSRSPCIPSVCATATERVRHDPIPRSPEPIALWSDSLSMDFALNCARGVC